MPVPASSHIHTFFNEPIAFRSGDASYFGLFGDTGIVGVGRYDHAKQIYEVGNPRGLSAAPIQVDDHNNPAVIRLHTGKILAAYGEHPGKAWASLSPSADEVTGTWTETQVADGSSLYNSYAHLAQTNDDLNTIWWFFRKGQTTTGGMPVCFRLNQNSGAGGSWQAPVELFTNTNQANQRPYFRMAWTGRRIDICYTDGQPDEANNCSLYHLYVVVSTDGTEFSVYKADGTLVDTWAITGGTGSVNGKTLPLNVSDGTKIYDGSTNEAWVWDVQWVDGTLYCCYPVFSQTTSANDTHLYRRATYSGTSWTHEDICYAGDSLTPATVGRVPHWIYPDANTAQAFYSPGICLDPLVPDRLYLGKKYGDGDVRIQRWDKSGTWSKTADLTGASGNGRVNARPFPVLGDSNALWFSANPYTTYLSYTTGEPGLVVPLTLSHTSKASTPVWTPAKAPNGTLAMYLIHEGSGTSVADLSGSHGGTITGGSLTWGSDSYGANLSGFSNSIAIVADTLAATGSFDGAVFPKWIAVLFKSLSSATGQYLAGFGNSGSNTPLYGAVVNNNADNLAGGVYRDASNVQNQVHVTRTRDTGYHTLISIAESASIYRAFYDGLQLGTATSTTGSVSFDRFTIGGLRRTSQGSGASGCTISAVIVGSGALPSPLHLHLDLINGQFLGSFDAAQGSVNAAGISSSTAVGGTSGAVIINLGR